VSAPAVLARVFPRRTKATPTDPLAFVGEPGLFPPEVDAVHVSATFTWDLRRAEELARAWAPVAPASIGGPATGEPGGEFVPGMYLREGYTITSRGCPNDCWFCYVPKREGALRELPIRDGWNVLDDNLLACSEAHFRAVCAMLARQTRPAEFTGGLEAQRLQRWHVEEFVALRVKQMFFAYDEPGDWEPLVEAAKLLREARILRPRNHTVRAFVFMGYEGDALEAADERCKQVAGLGIAPMAMLWRAEGAQRWNTAWRRLQREWSNPTILGHKMYALLAAQEAASHE